MSRRVFKFTEQELRGRLEMTHLEGSIAALDALASVIAELRGRAAAEMEALAHRTAPLAGEQDADGPEGHRDDNDAQGAK